MNKLKLNQLINLIIFFFVCVYTGHAQIDKSESVGNFYLKNNKLFWEKSYYLNDLNELDQQLRSNPFTSKLRILDFGNDAITDKFKLMASNLPQYAQSSYIAFIVIDVFQDYFRVRIQNITFPDFIENYYYNGMQQNSRTGSLENYILRKDGLISRTSANLNVLYSFDASFEEIFDYMAEPMKE